MEKYYTPELDEFHIGFEYEICYDDMWFIRDIPFYPLVENNNNKYRVKYLDKEDIESLGFKLIKHHPGTESYDYENLKNPYLYLDITYNHFDKIFVRIYEEEIQDDSFNYFSGNIKNKSELKKLLKQLNII